MAAPAPRTTTCVLGPQITVRGSLSGEEDLVVEGRLEGSVSLVGHLVVALDATRDDGRRQRLRDHAASASAASCAAWV